MWTKRRHRIFHFFFRWIANLVFRLKYNFKSKKYKLPKGAHLILFNHPSNFDPIFVGATFNRPTYFIANEDLFSLGFASKLINFLVAPIPKQKSVRDTSAIKTAIKIVEEGGNIGVSPEGNRTYSGEINFIDMSIVKFARLLKVPIVLYTIKGGFGVNPRFSTKVRKGKIKGQVEKILTVEEIKKLSNEDLLKEIINVLNVNDVKLGLEFKGKNLAEDLESALYVCPKCKSMSKMYSKRDTLSCMNCNLEINYTSKLRFESNDPNFTFETVNDYYVWQNDFMKKSNYKNIVFSDEKIVLSNAHRKRRKKALISGKIKLDREKIVVTGENETKEFYLKDIVSLAVLFHNILIINLEDTKYHINGDSKFNALKYLHLFTLLKNELLNIETKYLGI